MSGKVWPNLLCEHLRPELSHRKVLMEMVALWCEERVWSDKHGRKPLLNSVLQYHRSGYCWRDVWKWARDERNGLFCHHFNFFTNLAISAAFSFEHITNDRWFSTTKFSLLPWVPWLPINWVVSYWHGRGDRGSCFTSWGDWCRKLEYALMISGA